MVDILRCLNFEDDPALRQMVSDTIRLVAVSSPLISSSGIEIEECSDFVTGLKLVRQNQYDLALLDCFEGRPPLEEKNITEESMHGVQLAKNIFERHPNTVTTLLTASASTILQNQNLLESVKKAGVVMICSKPFGFEELKIIIEQTPDLQKILNNGRTVPRDIFTTFSRTNIRLLLPTQQINSRL